LAANGPREAWQLGRARRALLGGGLVLHATEGVWGLACDPFDSAAVGRLLAIKGRAPDKGLIVIADAPARFEAELAALGAAQRARVEASWPGAVTWIVPNLSFPDWISGGRSTVAVRVPGHAQARALCRAFGDALVSTSANLSGRPPAQSEIGARRQLVRAGFPAAGDYVLPGTVGCPGRPSSIRTPAGVTLRE
jgi:L-threonylcarbamoyladenylate synthase